MARLTLEKAQELLKTLPLVRVRTWQDNSNPHAGRAILLRLQGSKAVIKPHTHGKEEIVPLEELSEWKSGNAFYEQRKTMKNPQLTIGNGLAGGLGPSQKQFGPLPNRFVIVDKKAQRFYGGPGQRWVTDVSQALIQKTRGDADRSMYHIRRSDDGKNVEAVNRDVAIGLSSEWNRKADSVRPANETGTLAQTVEPSLSLSLEKPASNEPAKVAPTTGESSVDSLLSSLMAVDFDAIENDDGSNLLNAIHARKKAAADLKEARAMFIDAYQRFEETQKAYANLIKAFAPSLQRHEEPSANSGRMKKGSAGPLIKAFVRTKGTVASGEIVEHMIGLGFYKDTKNPASSCRQTIYGLVDKGELKKTPGGEFYAA
jgi:hypothetical protein